MLQVVSKEAAPLETVHGASKEEYRRMRVWLDERIAEGKKKPIAEVVTVTPVLATLLLAKNPINRSLTGGNLRTLGADIACDRWEFNGESIVVADTGSLIDGQHRLQSVVTTGNSIEAVVVFGPKEKARFTIDIGKPKSAPNFLHMKGMADTNNLAAMISLILQYRQNGHIKFNFTRPTKTEIVAAADGLHGIQDSVDFVSGATKERLGSRSVIAFCHYIFWKKSSRENADHFISRLIDGQFLRKDDPIYYCRTRLTRMDRTARADKRAELIFKCWNAWRDDAKIKKSVPLNGNLPKVGK